MQVRYTKAVFSKRTLIDATAKYADLFNIKDEISEIKVDRYKENDRICVHTKRVDAVTVKLHEKPNISMYV